MTYTLTIPSLQGFDIIFVCSLNWVLTTYVSCILFTCARTESVRMTHFHFISTSTQSVTMTAAQNSYHFVVVDSNVPVVVRIWYSSSSKGERNSKHLSSNSYRYIDSVKSLIIQTLRIIWVRCIPLRLRSKTRRRAALGFSPVDREGMSASPFPLRQTWRFYLRSISQTQFLSNDIPHSPAYGDIVRPSVVFCLVDTILTTVFAQSLSNFTDKLSMMRGGTLLILQLGHGVKGHLCQSAYKTFWAQHRLQF